MTSPQETLQNLAKIGKLKAEPPDQAEFDGLLRSARNRLPDAQNPGLNPESRFSLAYDAAHSLALAALRWHGYRSENRYIVFQILGSTVSLPKELHPWRSSVSLPACPVQIPLLFSKLSGLLSAPASGNLGIGWRTVLSAPEVLLKGLHSKH